MFKKSSFSSYLTKNEFTHQKARDIIPYRACKVNRKMTIPTKKTQKRNHPEGWFRNVKLD